MSSLKVYTTRLGAWSGPALLNITRKSGEGDGLVFAPSWSILNPAREGLKNADEMHKFASSGLDEWNAEWTFRRTWWGYVAAYTREMRQSYRDHRAVWERLLARDEVVLACYCANANLCHRTILAASILPTLGASYEGERPVPGEGTAP